MLMLYSFITNAIINGVLVGISVTAVSFIVVYLLKKGNSPSILTYLVVLAMLVVVSIEGALLSNAVKSKQDTNDIVALAHDAIMTCLPSEGQDYVINVQQSHAIKFAIRAASPSVARRIDASSFTGKTVTEAINMVRDAIERYVEGKVRARIVLVAVSSILLAVFLYLSFGFKRGLKRRRKISSGEAESISATRYGSDDF